MKQRESLWEDAPIIAHDAVFIADSHYKSSEGELSLDSEISRNKKACDNPSHELLSKLWQMSEAPPSQVFLMGDIAHVLVGSLHSSRAANAPLLEALQHLDRKTQIWWFEGNHDFCLAPLQRLLPNTHFIPRSKQPMAFLFHLEQHTRQEQDNPKAPLEAGLDINSESSPHIKSESIKAPNHNPFRLLLAHGDLFLNAKYEWYIRILTSRGGIFLLKILNYVTFGNLYHFFVRKINKKLIKEGRIEFNAFAVGRMESYYHYINARVFQKEKIAKSGSNALFDGIIEGHFHLGKSTKENQILYISLPSFYLTRSIFTIQSAFLNTNNPPKEQYEDR